MTILIICGVSLFTIVIAFSCLVRYISNELSRRDEPREEISQILRQIDNMEAREAKKKELIESMITNMQNIKFSDYKLKFL